MFLTVPSCTQFLETGYTQLYPVFRVPSLFGVPSCTQFRTQFLKKLGIPSFPVPSFIFRTQLYPVPNSVSKKLF